MPDSKAQRTAIYKGITLKGVDLCIMTGDSIADRLSNPLNLSNRVFRAGSLKYLYNQAFSGSNIANYTGGDSSTWNPLSIVTRSDANEVSSFDVDSCDILICWAGFNDKNDDIPLGTIGTNDPLTIAGAIKTARDNYEMRNPNMLLVWITPNANPYQTPNSLGLNIIDYRNHILAVCQNLGILCYDLYPNSGITEENKAEALPDQIHPSAAFLEVYASLIASFINANT